MQKFAFWNNKGGTGKTSLAFQVISRYADKNPDKKILAVDVCPQANLSELFLGGMQNQGSDNLLMRQGESVRATIGGYFQFRLPFPYKAPDFNPEDFLTSPSEYNEKIPSNISLLCGDPLLELQANMVSTMANVQGPIDSWIGVIDWLKDFLDRLEGKFDVVFLDTNPSFSIYTQVALSVADNLLLPVMADDSSRRAIQNVFSLVYGMKLPSEIYAKYAFTEKLKNAGRSLPKVHLILKNRITQYMGSASAYRVVLDAIDRDIDQIISKDPKIFNFESTKSGVVEIRDFQTAGVVAHARGCPFYALRSGSLDVLGKRIQVNEVKRKACVDHIDRIVDKL